MRWSKALDARRFVIAFAAPFFFGAWRSLRVPLQTDLAPRATAAALLFAGTLLLQAHGWSGLMNRVLAQVEADPRTVIPVEDFGWLQGSPAEHWGLGSQVIAKLGGRKWSWMRGSRRTRAQPAAREDRLRRVGSTRARHSGLVRLSRRSETLISFEPRQIVGHLHCKAAGDLADDCSSASAEMKRLADDELLAL
jgi:hypothetical protein